MSITPRPPKQPDIDEVLNECAESADTGKSKFPGKSYEAGVEAAIRWMTGETEYNPLDD